MREGEYKRVLKETKPKGAYKSNVSFGITAYGWPFHENTVV